jgi:hypothetical protein
MTNNGAMCNADGQLGVEEFEVVMREQILNYTQSRLSATSEFWNVSDQDFTELGTLKQLLMEQIGVKKELEATKRSLNGVLDLMQSARKHSGACERARSYHILRRSRKDQSACRTTSRTRRVSPNVCKEISGKVERLKMEILDIFQRVGLTDKESDGVCDGTNSTWPVDGSVSLHSSHGGSDGISTENGTAENFDALVTVPRGEENTFCLPEFGAALSSEVVGSPRPKSMGLVLDCGVNDFSKTNSLSCSLQEGSHSSSSHSQIQVQTRSSRETQHTEYPLAIKKWNSSGKTPNADHIPNNYLARESGDLLLCSWQSGMVITQQHAMFPDKTVSNTISHGNIKVSSCGLSDARCSFSSQFCEHPAMQKDQNGNGVLNLGTIPCLSGARNMEDIQPTAVDIPSDVSKGLADCAESNVIMLTGCA